MVGIIAGTALAVGGTAAQMYGAHKAKKEAQRQSNISYGKSNIDRIIADDKFNKAVSKLQQNYEDQKSQRADLLSQRQAATDEQLAMLGSQMAMYNQLASQGVPDATKALMMQQANRAASAQLAGAESARGSLGAAGRAQQGLRDTYTDLASMDAQQRLQNKAMQAQAQGMYANQTAAANQAMLNATQQNLDWDMAAKQQAYVDPQMTQAAMLYGSANRYQDYGAAAQGAAMQNQLQTWNALGQGAQQLGGYGMGYAIANAGGDGGGGRVSIDPMPTISTPINIGGGNLSGNPAFLGFSLTPSPMPK